MTVKNKTMKTVLLASLVAAIILPFGMMGFAEAEVSEEIKYKALEGKQIWDKLDHIKGKTEKTAQDKMLERELEKHFDEIAKEMNKHGIATPEQWEKNPDYWRMKNAPIAVTMVDPNEGSNSVNLDNNDSAGTATMAPGPCFCPQEFRFIAGFDFVLWGFWPSSAFASSWTSTTIAPNLDMISDVQTRADHGEIAPFVKFGLVKAGSAIITEEHSAENPGGVELSSSNSTSRTVARVIPSHHTVYYEKVTNPPVGTDIQVLVDVKSLA